MTTWNRARRVKRHIADRLGALLLSAPFYFCGRNRKELWKMKTDIEIAQAAEMLPIGQVAHKAGVSEELLEY